MFKISMCSSLSCMKTSYLHGQHVRFLIFFSKNKEKFKPLSNIKRETIIKSNYVISGVYGSVLCRLKAFSNKIKKNDLKNF